MLNPTGAEKKETSLGRCSDLYKHFLNDDNDKIGAILTIAESYGDAPTSLITEVIGVLRSTKKETFKKTYEAFNKKINDLIKGDQEGNYLIKVTPKGYARTPQMSFPFALKGDERSRDFILSFPKSASALSKSRGGNTLKKLSSTFNSALLKWVKEDQSRKAAFEEWALKCKADSESGNRAANYYITSKQSLSKISCIRWLKSMYKDDEEEDENILIKIARKEYEKLFEDII